MTTTGLHALYQELSRCTGLDMHELLPKDIQHEVGQFNAFHLADLWRSTQLQPDTPYPIPSFYKITLLSSRSRAECADKTIEDAPDALVFLTPNVSFQWRPTQAQQGQFCIFTAEFLLPVLGGLTPGELPLFKDDGYLVFQLTPTQKARAAAIFVQIHEELASDYAQKYDLLRAYVLELLHMGQKQQANTLLQPATQRRPGSPRFVELLERQFPLTTPQQRVPLRTAKDFAARLAVHVNHLNKVLKERQAKRRPT